MCKAGFQKTKIGQNATTDKLYLYIKLQTKGDRNQQTLSKPKQRNKWNCIIGLVFTLTSLREVAVA